MRPNLDTTLTADVFLDHYWLLKELTMFCQTHAIPASGGKVEVTTRIAHFLHTGETLRPKPRAAMSVEMPNTFSPTTVIQTGWRCSQNLRAFFVLHLGAGFKFNQKMRDFIADGAGKTLQQALNAYRNDADSLAEKPIEGQFEYNHFSRTYYKSNPDKSHDEMIAAWKIHRNTPKSQR